MKRKEKNGWIYSWYYNGGEGYTEPWRPISCEKDAAAVSIIGGADGPTAIFIAGKIDFTPVYIGTAILVLITAGYMIYRKNKKEGVKC